MTRVPVLMADIGPGFGSFVDDEQGEGAEQDRCRDPHGMKADLYREQPAENSAEKESEDHDAIAFSLFGLRAIPVDDSEDVPDRVEFRWRSGEV
jgi:hypothetical protein